MSIEIETRSERTETGWRDRDGFVGPFQPGNGPRTDPRGDFPTGPEVGTLMPDVCCLGVGGENVELHLAGSGKPAIFVFFRSAVW